MVVEAENERWATQKTYRWWSEASLLLLLLEMEYDGISSFEPRVSTERNMELGIPGGASDSSLYRRLNDVATKLVMLYYGKMHHLTVIR